MIAPTADATFMKSTKPQWAQVAHLAKSAGTDALPQRGQNLKCSKARIRCFFFYALAAILSTSLPLPDRKPMRSTAT